MKRVNTWKLSTIVLLIVALVPVGHYALNHMTHSGNVEEMRADFIQLKTDIQQELMPNAGYRCCLEKACTYCIEKDPKHGEGATCDCLADIVDGKHPCGECIGEILEGHGNPYLKEYFALAIADEVGMEHIDTIQQIIDEKYGA